MMPALKMSNVKKKIDKPLPRQEVVTFVCMYNRKEIT